MNAHRDEAERLIGMADMSDLSVPDPYVDRIIALAQVHATLATIEEATDGR